MPHKKRLLVLISGGGSNLQSLINACQCGAIDGEIVAVISNRPGVYGLKRAQKAAIPAIVIDHTQYSGRAEFDQKLMEAIDAYRTDLVILAGFMRILTPELVQHYQGRMLNIHPSLLPAHKGTQTHQRALDNGENEHGASVHFVTPELDDGPLVIQARVPVLPNDNADTLKQRVLEQEHRIYPKAVGWFCEGRLQLCAGQVVYLDGEILKEPTQQ